ncbi:MAG TPA: hypothetical protein PLS56_00670 [Candidatus Dojkabacteria bacterium]|nr:hypothetical protein [Candidatus Dojkabacteria bacterium]
MTDFANHIQHIPRRVEFSKSNIIRVVCFALLIGIYSIYLSPRFETIIVKNISQLYRNYSFVQINALTPVYDVYTYSGTYDLSSDTKNASLISRSKFYTIDPRIVAMSNFLKDYHSPMAKSAKTFVTEADKYGLDWRLLASISGVESAFGNLIPTNTNNAWGWRGINGNDAGWSVFSSWDEAISHITQMMAQGYGTDLDPFEIESAYCPPCGQSPDHAWANGVNNYMNELSYYVNNLSDF